MSARICPSCRHELPASSAFCPTCGTRTIDAATPDAPPAASGSGDDAAHRARLQRALGDGWQLSRLVGRGGFADVYAVWDLQLRRQVAVKTLRSDLAVSSALLQRFRREAEAIARLRHPHIVPIYAVGEGEALAYFVMPLLEGESLAAPLARGEAFTIAEARRILRESASALGAAHRTGVIHRDVKPDNIMLEGPERRAVVMDFGISKLADASEAGLTGTGFLIGSPHYMSPEQAAGERELDHRTDQYALAVVGFQMLTGRTPFQAGSVQAMLMKQVTEAPPSVRELRPDVPEPMAAAIDRALSKDPDQRFASMEEFAAALGPADDGAVGATSGARRRLDPRVRAAAVRETIARWRAPALALAVLGLAGFLAAYFLTTPRAGTRVAAQREEAVFAGKAFLAAQGVPRDAATVTTFVHEDSVYHLIQRGAGSPREADSLASAAGVWRWRVRQFDRPRRVTWNAYVGVGGTILGYDAAFPDTAQGANLTTDSARALAAAALGARGWDAGSLRFEGDSVVRRMNRTDHVLRWIADGRGIRGPDETIAPRHVLVDVTGDRVTGYRERILLPAGALAPARSALDIAAGTLGALVCTALLVLAFVTAIRRSRIDELQWGPMVRVALLPVIGLAIVMALEMYEDVVITEASVGQTMFGALLTLLFVLSLALGLYVFTAVAAESLASETRPSTAIGFVDVARGRVFVPEVATAALVGYAAALCSLAATYGADALAARAFGVPLDADLPNGLTMGVPSTITLVSLSSVVPLGIGLLYGVALAAWRRRWTRALLVLPALTFGALGLGIAGDELGALELVALVIVTLALTLAVWRFGILAGFVALLVIFTLPDAIGLLASGDANRALAGLVTLAVLAVPGVLAVVAHRRLARAAAGLVTTPTTPTAPRTSNAPA